MWHSVIDIYSIHTVSYTHLDVYKRQPLLPIAKLILDKYKGGEKLLPIQDPADINKYLKDIAILCGINKQMCIRDRYSTLLVFSLFLRLIGMTLLMVMLLSLIHI